MIRKTLPSIRKTTVTSCVTLLSIVAFIWMTDINVSVVDKALQHRINQTGLLFAYAGFLFGMHRFFWHHQAQLVTQAAEAKITVLTAQNELLAQLRTDIGKDYTLQIFTNSESIAQQEATLQQVAEQERVERLSGWLGVAGVAIGSFLQIISVG